MIDVQILAALNRIASALEKANTLREEQKARSERKPDKKTFRYPPHQSTRDYPQKEK